MACFKKKKNPHFYVNTGPNHTGSSLTGREIEYRTFHISQYDFSNCKPISFTIDTHMLMVIFFLGTNCIFEQDWSNTSRKYY